MLVALTPSLLAALWLALMGGHNFHGWVSLALAAITVNLLFLSVLNLNVGREQEVSAMVGS